MLENLIALSPGVGVEHWAGLKEKALPGSIDCIAWGGGLEAKLRIGLEPRGRDRARDRDRRKGQGA